jgi:hypothetical protein
MTVARLRGDARHEQAPLYRLAHRAQADEVIQVRRSYLQVDAESAGAATHNAIRDNFGVLSVTHRSVIAIRNVGRDETFDLKTWSRRG